MSYTIDLSLVEKKELARLRKVEKDGKLLRRYQCIYLVSEKFPKKEVATILAVNIDTVTDWVKLFNKQRFLGLKDLKYEGRRPSTLDKFKDEIKKHIELESICTIAQLQDYLKTEYKITIEHSWLSRYLKKNLIALTKKQD